MSEKLRESLSATMDGEADEFELRRVLDEMQKDGGLREVWSRYHIAGMLMRGERVHFSSDIRERVWSQLQLGTDDEAVESAALPAAQAGPADGPRSRLGRLAGLAVAASVAFAAVIGVIGLWDEGAGEPPATAGTVTIEGPRVSNPAFTSEISPRDLQRANAYMMHHFQHQGMNQPGVSSFVKMVTYERR
ncbi:MAG TPA: sigma-E factor negative regulatory protein [Pseudomonadales bacterium]|jgi:negative regulator of sigma E activity